MFTIINKVSAAMEATRALLGLILLGYLDKAQPKQ